MKAACLALCLSLLSATARAQCCNGPAAPAPAPPASAGSTAFCLFEVPADDNGRRKWINLGIVQYVELGRNELRLSYGGGNFGGGHETRMAVASPADGAALLDRIRQTAAACK